MRMHSQCTFEALEILECKKQSSSAFLQLDLDVGILESQDLPWIEDSMRMHSQLTFEALETLECKKQSSSAFFMIRSRCRNIEVEM